MLIPMMRVNLVSMAMPIISATKNTIGDFHHAGSRTLYTVVHEERMTRHGCVVLALPDTGLVMDTIP